MCWQDSTNKTHCLQPQICVAHLTHTVSEVEILCMLPKLILKIETYQHDKKRVVRNGGRKE